VLIIECGEGIKLIIRVKHLCHFFKKVATKTARGGKFWAAALGSLAKFQTRARLAQTVKFCTASTLRVISKIFQRSLQGNLLIEEAI